MGRVQNAALSLKGGITYMVEVKNLTKLYGGNRAVDNVSFKVEEGSIVGFLGPNGAGKSTTMNIITGYLSATSGTVTIGGKTILDDPSDVKKMVGYLPEHPPLYLDMTVSEYLNFMYELKGVKLNRKTHLQEICRLTKITDVYKRLIGNLSKGYRQRVGIAQALLGNPHVLILDEPTVGLDPKQIIEIRNLITNLGKNHTVILSSHILPEVQAVCERIIVINEGKLVADGATDTLAHDLSEDHRVIVRVAGIEKEIVSAVKHLPNVIEVYSMGEKEPGAYDISVEAKPDVDVRRDLFALFSRSGWPILAMKNTDMTLEELFLQLTTKDSSVSADRPKLKFGVDAQGLNVKEEAEQNDGESDDKSSGSEEDENSDESIQSDETSDKVSDKASEEASDKKDSKAEAVADKGGKKNKKEGRDNK